MADINFEHIDPWVDGQGDTGLTSRQKLRRNFEKIKAWMDSVASMLSGKYLSKEDDDEAEGVITFKAGSLFGPLGVWGWVKETVADRVGTGWAWFKNLLADTLEALSALINGNLTVHGGDLTVEEDELGNGGDASIEGNLDVGGLATIFRAVIQQLQAGNLTVTQTATIANLIVTGAAHFFKVIIDEIKAAGGSWIITPADPFTVDLVEDITINGVPGKRLFWRATDGERKRANKWQAGDQALCKTDNLATGASYNVSNKYYWSLVAAVSSSPVQRLFNGVAADCHYIDIYCGNGETQDNIPTDANDVPLWHYAGDPREAAAGDSVAMLGHRGNDIPRQSAIYIAAYSSIDAGVTAPVFASYEGIKTFDLAQYRKTYKDANGAAFYGRFFSTATDSDNPTDIEDLLTGSEIHIIYGNGSPLVTRPEQHWAQADYAKYADKWFYFDISEEPADDGGRLWKWVLIAASGNVAAHYGWQEVTDVDTIAALEKIADVASDGKLTGGGEKTRILLQWKEALEYYTSTVAVTPTDMASSTSSCMGSTFAAICTAAQTAWTALCSYLNGQQTFDGGVQDAPLWISVTLNENRVKKEDASDPTAWKACLLTTTVLPTLSEVQDESAADTYRRKWTTFYEAMSMLDAAQLKWQEKEIDEMGDDGLLDAEEKASLRQVLNGEVLRFFELTDDAASFGTDGSGNYTGVYIDAEGDEQTIDDSSLREALNKLGSYLDNNFQRGVVPISSQPGVTPTMPAATWWIEDDMRQGLEDPAEGVLPGSHSATPNRYPLWLQRGNETADTVVDDDEWDNYWNTYFTARAAMVDMLSRARKKSVEDIVDAAQPTTFIQYNTPTNYKAGDHWYKPVTLTNPVDGTSVSTDGDGNLIYDHYVAKVVSGTLRWVLVTAATTSVFSQLANEIYTAVFDSTNASSIVSKADSITSTVSAIKRGGRNLLLNADFEEETDDVLENFDCTSSLNTSIAQAAISDLAGFEHAALISVNASSGSNGRGLRMPSTLQPNITLENGKLYTLSAWLKSSTSSAKIQVRRGGLGSGNSVGDMKVVDETSAVLTSTWKRFSVTFYGNGSASTLVLCLLSSSSGANITGSYYVAGIQLEEGNVATTWAKANSDITKLSSEIKQAAEKISMAVFKDEARKAGIDIEYDEESDSGTVTLDGDKTIITGDLDVKGLITNSAQNIGQSGSTFESAYLHELGFNDGTIDEPSSHKLIIPVDLKTTKSVFVKPIYPDNNESGAITFDYYDPLIILPGYNEVYHFNGTTVDLPECRVNGLQMVFGSEFSLKNKSWRGQSGLKIDSVPATIICSDPRCLHWNQNDSSNYVSPTNARPENCFLMGGHTAKFIVLFPGQTVRLLSHIHHYGTTPVLNWIVENGYDLDARKIDLISYWSNSAKTSRGSATIHFGRNDQYNSMTILAPAALEDLSGDLNVFELYSQQGQLPWWKATTVTPS